MVEALPVRGRGGSSLVLSGHTVHVRTAWRARHIYLAHLRRLRLSYTHGSKNDF